MGAIEPQYLKIGYQGERGAYSDRAIDFLYKDKGDKIEKAAYRTSYAVVEALKKGTIHFGLLPIENSIVGTITHNYDLLLENKLTITQEVILPIHHALLAHPDANVNRIKTIYSHPAAIAQCEVFLRRFKETEILPTYDTAGSAKMIARQTLRDVAAIAAADTAEIYNLQVLRDKIEDYPNNQTRFVLVSNEPVQQKESQAMAWKVSAVFDTLDQPGMLYQCLGIFERHGVNLTMLTSRPHKTEPWKYHFFVDMNGHINDPPIAEAFDEINKLTGFVHVFGSYPHYEQPDREDTWMAVPGGSRRKNEGPLYSRDYKKEDTVVIVGDKRIGDGHFTLIAGPCSVEGRHPMMESAKIVAEHGAELLRGGAFKPRTSPYSFQGLGEEGLHLLKEAGDLYNLPVVSEVLAVEDVPLVAQYADMLQIGARNMQNFILLKEAGKTMKPILLKRGMMATVKELLLSAEYILAQGNDQVVLCERGIRTFETATRNTLDISAIPLLKQNTHLPVLVDPSHATGVPKLIVPVSKAARAAGADGLMVEVHFNPSAALSDADQALNEKQFKDLVAGLQKMKL